MEPGESDHEGDGKVAGFVMLGFGALGCVSLVLGWGQYQIGMKRQILVGLAKGRLETHNVNHEL